MAQPTFEEDEPSTCTVRLARVGCCIGYIMAVIGIFQYFFSVLHTFDALEMIESFFSTNHNGTLSKAQELDWGWLTLDHVICNHLLIFTVGWITVLCQLYILVITCSILMEQNDAMVKNIYFENCDPATYVMVVDSLFAIVYGLVAMGFYVLCTVYNYKILGKVLECSPPEGMEILRNHTSFPVDTFVEWTFHNGKN